MHLIQKSLDNSRSLYFYFLFLSARLDAARSCPTSGSRGDVLCPLSSCALEPIAAKDAEAGLLQHVCYLTVSAVGMNLCTDCLPVLQDVLAAIS